MNIILFHLHELSQPIGRNDPRSRHIRRVLKSSEGDVLRVGVLNGDRGTATITRLTTHEIHLEFHVAQPPLPVYPIRLVCGLPRPQQAKRILRDCTSMGVSHIWFVHTELGEKSYRHSPLWQNESWLGLVREGLEQSGGTHLPEIRIHHHLQSCFANLPETIRRYVFDTGDWTPASIPADAGPRPSTQELALIIGSERGWTDGERLFLQKSGCVTLCLGQHVLRTDTACIAAVTLARTLFLG
ncbi:16S rRNA (uracil(1498)-N(3))-methyltransferase [bacterium]|nr:16S rRNA (uracil(1498)-N(3))-methyltransferase [candidate division CSSED10-310 bacterium]